MKKSIRLSLLAISVCIPVTGIAEELEGIPALINYQAITPTRGNTTFTDTIPAAGLPEFRMVELTVLTDTDLH